MLCKKVGKRAAVLMLAAGMLLGAAGPSQAIEFKAQGEWLVGFGVGTGDLVRKENGNYKNADDKFGAAQRIRLQLDAVASENLSGTVHFEIGDQKWGSAEDGGALGADGKVVKVKHAYLDWSVPSTDLQFRMGIQPFAMPNAAGGSAIMDADSAGITANYKFSDNVGLSAFWMRPVNDNFAGDYNADHTEKRNNKGFLDNMDFFGVSVPLAFDGVEVTPWAMYGVMGKNALEGYDYEGNELLRPRWEDDPDRDRWGTEDGMLHHSLLGWHPGMNVVSNLRKASNPYTSMFFVGLPIAVTALDPLNIEFDFNYGYVGGYGSYDVEKADGSVKAADTLRSGWLVKALVEYKMDWGTPGIFGWYASGDDSNPGNGSERMPSVAGCAGFTSFISESNMDFAPSGSWIDRNLTLAGTWGVGLQVADMSFVEDLSHTLRVAYWGGTNSPTMAKYMSGRSAWDMESPDGPYLTTNDGLLEFNLVNEYKIYENLTANLELGYVVNMIDRSTWKKAGGDTTQRQDAWKAQVIFAYSF